MPDSDQVRELLARAEMHEKAAEATEDERARKMELAMAAELRRKAKEIEAAADTPLHRIRTELQEKLHDRENRSSQGPENDSDLAEIRETIGELNRVIKGVPRSGV